MSSEEKVLLPYSIIYLLISYPILEKFHSAIGGMVTTVMFIYTIHKCIIEELEFNKKYIKYFTIGLIIIFLIYSMMLFTSFMIKKEFVDETSVYYGSLYNENEKEGIERITNYIKKSEQKVMILCPQAALYNISLKIDNGILDLPTQGNVGRNGSEKIIKLLEKEKDYKILLSKEKIFWQEFDEVRNWVKDNAELVGEIEGTSFYYEIYNVKK